VEVAPEVGVFERIPGSLFRASLISVLLTALLFGGTLGFYLIEGASWFDSFYMALITLTTVGYGEVFTLSTAGRVFNSILMISGVTVMFISVAILADLVLKLELAHTLGQRRRLRMFQKLTKHYIVCGAGRVGRGVVNELLRNHASVLVIDINKDRAEWAIERGIPTLIADATRDATLREAHIDAARGLVAALSSDAENVYVTLAARALSPDLVVSARSSDEEAGDKLRTAGATTVLAPYGLIGHRLAQSLLSPHVLSFLDVASAFEKASGSGLEIGQVPVTETNRYLSETLESSQIRQRYGVIVVAIRKPEGGMCFNPSGETRIESGDYLIAMGESDGLRKMQADFS